MLTGTYPLSELTRWGRESRTIEARLAIARLSRLTEMLADTQGELEVKLSFSLIGNTRLAVRGEVKGVLHLTCQRCLQSMDWPVALHFAQAVVDAGDQATELPAGHEPWLPVPEGVALWELPEDELLLTLPDYPKHPQDRCKPFKTSAAPAEGQNNPFAKLRNKL